MRRNLVLNRTYQICTNCVMDTSDVQITFDEHGVCDHCRNFKDSIQPNWHTDERGKKMLGETLDKIRRNGQGKEYDCLIGLSGGVDSSYVAYASVKKWGLKPLIFTVDTGWNLPVAESNVQKIIGKLNVPAHNEIIDFEEMKDLQLAYFESQVPYQDTPQDHAIFASLYRFAAKNGIKYIITGGNYSTECVREPNEWVHCNDIVQIRDIHRRFGQRPLKNFPLCGMFKYRLIYRYLKGVQVIKALDWIPYTKADAIATLQREFDWEPYENKHYESVFTRFYEGYWLVKKFGYDKRRCHFSSLILTGQMTRDDALEKLSNPPYDEALAMQDMEYICDKLGITTEAFMQMMQGENKTYKDYRSSFALINAATNFARLVGAERRNFR